MFKPIPCFEGIYEINEHGEIRSLDRYVENNGTFIFRKGQTIKPFINGSGYLQVGISKNGMRHRLYVHKLVAKTFLPNTEMLEEVNHIDHNKLNNHFSNLEWCTRKENILAMRKFYNLDTKVVSKILFCEHCGKSFEPADAKKFCSQTCFRQSSRRTDRPSAEDLVVEIKALGFCGVGRKYGVSDNAIRKWCKNYGLPTNSKSYK